LIELVTHVIPNKFNEADYNAFTKFIHYTEVVRLAWLLDSITTQQLLPPDEYRFRRNKFQSDQNTTAEVWDSAARQLTPEANSMNWNTQSNG